MKNITPHNNLEAEAITFSRNDTRIIPERSFKLSPGEMLWVTGANGSGKSTLLKMLTGLLQPTNGLIYWGEKPITHTLDAYQQAIFYLGHQAPLKMHLTVQEQLNLDAGLHSTLTSKIQHDVLQQLNLINFTHTRIDKLSAGQRCKVALAKLWLLEASIWILDEPFTALDQQSANLLKLRIVDHLQQKGIVVITSHQPFYSPEMKSTIKTLEL